VDAPSRDDDLRQAITTATQRLAELDVETQQVRARLEALHAELTLADAAPERALIPPRQNPDPSNPAPKSTAEKLAIFRRLFRGREDVYPVRFVSKKTGKAGYAPACANKFVRGVCELPRVKCGACSHQAFMPADDAAVLDHLQGRLRPHHSDGTDTSPSLKCSSAQFASPCRIATWEASRTCRSL